MTDLPRAVSTCREASRRLERRAEEEVTLALLGLAEALLANPARITEASRLDRSTEGATDLDGGLIERRDLERMAEELRVLSRLDPPKTDAPDERVAPYGVLGFWFDLRPELLVRAVGMALLTRNALVLGGPGATRHGAKSLATTLSDAGLELGLPLGFMKLLPNADELLVAHRGLDLVILRDSSLGLCTSVPTWRDHRSSGCAFLDKDADLEAAVALWQHTLFSPRAPEFRLNRLVVHPSIGEAAIQRLAAHPEVGALRLRFDPLAKSWWDQAAGEAAGPSARFALSVEVADDHTEVLESLPEGRPLDAVVSPDEAVVGRFLRDSAAAWVAVNGPPPPPPLALAFAPGPIGPEQLVRIQRRVCHQG